MPKTALMEAISHAYSSGGNVVRTIRQVTGYSVEDLAVTSGLAIDEIERMEAGTEAVPGGLRRIAGALGLPSTTVSTT